MYIYTIEIIKLQQTEIIIFVQIKLSNNNRTYLIQHEIILRKLYLLTNKHKINHAYHQIASRLGWQTSNETVEKKCKVWKSQGVSMYNYKYSNVFQERIKYCYLN